jgi:hypothetical protein
MMDRRSEQLERDGYGLWAVEVRTSGDFIGFVGLAAPICGCGVHTLCRDRLAASQVSLGSRLCD